MFLGRGAYARMMNQPPMDVLREQVDSRYTLVVLASKRARQLLEGAKAQVDANSDKPVTVALQEIAARKLEWERTAIPLK